jgi:hypothetical protein
MRLAIRAAVIAAAVLILGAVYIRSQPPEVVAVGAPVRQDDFVYTVTRVVKHRSNGMISYVVSIRVDNQAKIVGYRWSGDTAYVTDSTGRRYHAEEASRSATRERPPIAAGSSADYDMTFHVPDTAGRPMLRYWNGFMMGDVFDGAAYSRAAVAL